jgi:soluble lytic murein transglycosylase
LEQPETSIALGAAYLRELKDRFAGDVARMVVAYNAGEAQADAWKRYCFSDDPAEFYTKVTFRETRGYLDKVLTSYGHYRELYGRNGA